MYDFYVLYLHVICICRSGAPVVKCEIILLNPNLQHYWGIPFKKWEILRLKWLSPKTKWPDFWFYKRSICMSDESKKVRKRNSLIMFQLGSKSPYCTTWICSCTVWLRTLAMISISIAVSFALEFLFWYYVFLFRFYFVKGFYRLKSVCMS